MINLKTKFKDFGLLETLVLASVIYVLSMLTWTAMTRSGVEEKANMIKNNHKQIVDFLNNQINECDSNKNQETVWGAPCSADWLAQEIVAYIKDNIQLENPYDAKDGLIKTTVDPRLQAEGRAGQSTDKGVIFVTEGNFSSAPGSEWIVGTCFKSPCVAAGNNELVSVYR